VIWVISGLNTNTASGIISFNFVHVFDYVEDLEQIPRILHSPNTGDVLDLETQIQVTANHPRYRSCAYRSTAEAYEMHSLVGLAAYRPHLGHKQGFPTGRWPVASTLVLALVPPPHDMCITVEVARRDLPMRAPCLPLFPALVLLNNPYLRPWFQKRYST